MTIVNGLQIQSDLFNILKGIKSSSPLWNELQKLIISSSFVLTKVPSIAIKDLDLTHINLESW